MAWLPKSDAAHTLGVSPRTLARRLSEGKFKTKSNGRRILVQVPDEIAHPQAAITREHTERLAEAAEQVATTGGQLAELAAGAQERRDADIVAATMLAINETRAVLDSSEALIRQTAERAHRAQQRALQIARWSAGIGLVLVLAAWITAVYLGRVHHTTSTALADELHQVEASLASAEARLDEKLAGLRAATEAQLHEKERAIADVQDQVDEVRTTEREEGADILCDREAELAAATAELAAMRAELDRLCWDRDEALQDRSRLADEVATLRKEARERQPSLRLRELIDESWGGGRSVVPEVGEPR